ncbi:MAG: 50S ribosomal protein L1 [Candidatus Coatesbacteria bacterium]|nr:MAG: 50S ribosomal protein L1 [Candidatus Coatesbacteria bacterium]
MAGKKYKESRLKIDRSMEYGLDDACRLTKECAYAGFDESVDLAFRLGVDPKHADQMVRGSVSLPHGTGKTPVVLVFAKGEKVKEAEAAGADYVGLEEYAEKVQKGWIEFDAVVATPDVMKEVGKLGKVLGPHGLMPSPKTGTVTFDVGPAVDQIKKGKVDYKVDKGGNVHIPVGRVSFDAKELFENAAAAIESVVKNRPASAKGTYLKRLTISTTHGPGIRINRQEVQLMVAG